MEITSFSQIFPVVSCVVAFLLGSVPFGLLVARLFKVNDLSSRGSGNIGATNVSRVLGFWPAGAMTLALDMLKGMIPVFLLQPLGFGLWSSAAGLGEYSVPLTLTWGVGLAAVLGHCFSPWMHFKGGKGVATGFGIVLLLSPISGLIGALAFIITFLSTRIGSLSSIAGLIMATTTDLIVYPVGAHLWLGAVLISVILIRHESNIDALLENREKAF